MVKSAMQGLAIFFGMQFVMSKFMGPKTTTSTDADGAIVTVPANTADIPPFLARPDYIDDGAVYNPIAQRIAPMWPLDSPLDITVIVSPTFNTEPIAKVPAERVVLNEKGFVLGSYDENRVIDTSFAVPKEVQNNGTLWAHFYVGLEGTKLDPTVAGYDPTRAYHFLHPLTQYITQKKVKKVKNLLSGGDADEVGKLPPHMGEIADRIARGRSSYWTNCQLALPPQPHCIIYPRRWSHALPDSQPSSPTVRSS